MWVKLFIERLEAALLELKDASGLEFFVFSKMGKYMVGTAPVPKELVKVAKEFIDSLAELQTVGTYHLTKIEIQEQLEYVLVSDVSSSQEQTFAMDKMAAAQVKRIHEITEQILPYDRTGFGQVVEHLPEEFCQSFLNKSFPENQLDALDDETWNIVHAMMDHNLNVSEAARHLGMHRNTLVYRLERLHRMLGLDMRRFDDAMIFRMAMMMQEQFRSLA